MRGYLKSPPPKKNCVRRRSDGEGNPQQIFSRGRPLCRDRRSQRRGHHRQKGCAQTCIEAIHKGGATTSPKTERTAGLRAVSSNSPLAQRPSSRAKCGSGAAMSTAPAQGILGNTLPGDEPRLPEMKAGLPKSRRGGGMAEDIKRRFFFFLCELIYSDKN